MGLTKEEIEFFKEMATDKSIKMPDDERKEYVAQLKKEGISVGSKKTTKKKSKKKSKVKMSSESVAELKKKIKDTTGKTEKECEDIIAQYKSIREKTNKSNKKRVSTLKKKGEIIKGTDEKTADAVLETTKKEVKDKIEKEIKVVEKEAKKQVDKTNLKPADNKKAVEKKVKAETKKITKKMVVDTSGIISAITSSLASHDKDSAKEFLIKLRSDVDKLIKKYVWGGNMAITQTYNIAQSNMSSSSVNPSQFADGGEIEKGGEVGKTYQIKGADVRFYEDNYEEGEKDQFHSYYLGENDFPYKTKFSNKKDLFETLNDFVSYADMKEEDFYVDEDTIQTSAIVKHEKGSDWDEFSAPTEKEKELWKKGEMKLYSAQFVFPYEVYKKEKLEFADGGSVDWGFIEEHYPNYDGSDEIMQNNDLQRYVDGEDIDAEMVKEEWGFSTMKEAKEMLDTSNEQIMITAMENKNSGYKKGGTIIHSSDKYGSDYWLDNDGVLFYRPITTDGSVEEWSLVSEEAFSESERKEFDKEMKKLFGKKINFKKGGRLKSALMRDRKYVSEQEWEQRYSKGKNRPRYKKKSKFEVGGFIVMNRTDGFTASGEVFETREEAQEFVDNFPKRYEAQGYYRNNNLEKINPQDVELEIIDVEEDAKRKTYADHFVKAYHKNYKGYAKGGYTLTELDRDVIKQWNLDKDEYIARKIEQEKIKDRQDYKVGDKVHWVQDDYKGNYSVDTSRTDEIVRVSGEKGDREYETREIGGKGRVGRAFEGGVVKVGDKVYHARYNKVYEYGKGGKTRNLDDYDLSTYGGSKGYINHSIKENEKIIKNMDKYLNSPMENSEEEYRSREKVRMDKAKFEAEILRLKDELEEYAKGGKIEVGVNVKYPKATMIGEVIAMKDSSAIPNEKSIVVRYNDGKEVRDLASSFVYVNDNKVFAKGGEIASAIFSPNSKKGKISTSFGDKTKEGLTAMIENDSYSAKEIANAIFEFNEKRDKVKTNYGDKTKEGLISMIESARDSYEKGGKVKVQHYGNTLHDFDVINKNEAEDRINKLLNRYNKKRNTTSNYAIYYEDENGKITSWQKFAKGGTIHFGGLRYKLTKEGVVKEVRGINGKLLKEITNKGKKYRRNSTYKTYNSVEGNELLNKSDIRK